MREKGGDLDKNPKSKIRTNSDSKNDIKLLMKPAKYLSRLRLLYSKNHIKNRMYIRNIQK